MCRIALKQLTSMINIRSATSSRSRFYEQIGSASRRTIPRLASCVEESFQSGDCLTLEQAVGALN